MGNRLPLPIILLVMATAAAPDARAVTDPPPHPLSLEWCLDRAGAASPEIAADASAAEAARQRVAPAGALEDPRIGYEASNVPIGDWDFSSTPLSGHEIRLAQKVPFPGLLAGRRAAAEAGADAAEALHVQRTVDVRARVEAGWAELGFSQRALEITDRNIELLRQLVQIAEARYRVGSGLQQDVLRAHVELTALLQQRLVRVAEVRTAEAHLAALLDLPASTRLPRTGELLEAAPVPDFEPLLHRLEEANPRLQAARARVSEAEQALRAVRYEGYPDFDLGIGYRVRRDVRGDPVDGDDFVSAGVTIRLPVNRGKWRARVAEHEALVRRAEADRRGVHAALRDRLQASLAALERSSDEVALIETGLLPQARQSLESNRAGYEVGRVDFPAVLDTQINLLEAELRLERAVADRRAAFASLEAAVGEGVR